MKQYVYVFVRQDIPVPQQLVQSNHATLSISSHYGIEGIPNIVMIGVPDQAGLQEAARILADNQIPHWNWEEPDFDYGFTAIATAPVEGERRSCLAHYKLWQEQVIHPWPNCKAAPSKGVHAGVSPAG